MLLDKPSFAVEQLASFNFIINGTIAKNGGVAIQENIDWIISILELKYVAKQD